jgi:hypothetical protein
MAPLGGGGRLPFREGTTGPHEAFHTPAAVSAGSLFLASNEAEVTRVRAVPRGPGEPRLLTAFDTEAVVHLYCQDSTLVLLERAAQDQESSTALSVHDFRVTLWDAESLRHVAMLEFLPHLADLPAGGHSEVSDVALAKDSLALHVFTDRTDGTGQGHNRTLFWRLDTTRPAEESLRFHGVLRKPHLEGEVSDTGFIFLNDRFFLRQLEELFPESDCFATQVQVFKLEPHLALAALEPSVIDVNRQEVSYSMEGEDSLRLEPGAASRLAIFNALANSFKVFDLPSGSLLQCLDLRLETSLGAGPLLDVRQWFPAGWVGGRFALLAELVRPEGSSLRLVLVVEGELVLGRELGSGGMGPMPDPTRAVADLAGAVLVTEDRWLVAYPEGEAGRLQPKNSF